MAPAPAKPRVQSTLIEPHIVASRSKRGRPGQADPAKQRADLVDFLGTLPSDAFDPPAQFADPPVLDESQSTQLAERLAAGIAPGFPGGSTGNAVVRLVLGLDFGTSCTKIVVRAPDMTQFKAVAVPALPFARADQHPFLWVSQIWLDADGGFSLVPDAEQRRIVGIKAGLMGQRPASQALASVAGRAITPLHAATAFLALMIRQARGWIYTHMRERFDRGRVQWSLNLGFPAARLEPAMQRLYDRALCAAWSVAGMPGPVSLVTCETALAAGASPSDLHRRAIIPEIVAAMNGFIQSYAREDGLFALVDVGATTLDVSSFTLFSDREGDDRISIWLADVERFGVRPWHLCRHDGTCAPVFKTQTSQLLTGLLWKTRRYRDPANPVWQRGGELRVFCTGGGISEPMFRDTLQRLDPWLQQAIKGSRGVRLRVLDRFADLELAAAPDADPGRLLVAFGLSYPDLDLPGVTLPDEIEDIDPPSIRDAGRAYVDKDQV